MRAIIPFLLLTTIGCDQPCDCAQPEPVKHFQDIRCYNHLNQPVFQAEHVIVDDWSKDLGIYHRDGEEMQTIRLHYDMNCLLER